MADEIPPAEFDRFDSNRCLNRALIYPAMGPVQCVKDVFEYPCQFEHPLDEPRVRAEIRRLAGGDE